MIRTNGDTEVLPSKCDHVKVEVGDILHYVTWGGGGWGDPLDRAAELVALEVKRGLVTHEGAKRYGVVLDDHGAVVEPATESLRDEIRQQRGDLAVFDYGAPLDELKRRSMEETGLMAPRDPVFGAR